MATPGQASLFDDGTDKGVRIVEVLNRAKPADKAQATFQRLVTQLEQQRALLQLWHDYLVRYNQRISKEMMPLQSRYRQCRRDLALLFDDILGRPDGLRGKRQRAQLQRELIGLIQDLLSERSDSELEAIHDRHSAMTYAEDQELEKALSQDMLESILGIDLGDQHHAENLDELFARAGGEWHAHQAREQQEREPRKARKRKTRKAEEAEAKRAQAAKELSQSVRDVYRKLASALHPDRETDPAVRQYRTEQMQRVNRAYEAGDLLSLLNIQLEIEQIDASHLASLPAERLAHYNQVLREQLAELRAENDSVAAPFLQMVPYTQNLTPDKVDRALTEAVAHMGALIEQVKGDLVNYKDPKRRSAALKALKSRQERHAFADLDLDDIDDLDF